jgi:hypothetical protein
MKAPPSPPSKTNRIYSGDTEEQTLVDWHFSVLEYLEHSPEINERDQKMFVTTRLTGAAHTWYRTQVTHGTSFSTANEVMTGLQNWRNFLCFVNEDRVQLATLAQTGTVTELLIKLQRLLDRLPQVTDDEAKHRFRRMLKPEIQERLDSAGKVHENLATLFQEALIHENVIKRGTKQPYRIPNNQPYRPGGGDAMDVDILAIQREPFPPRPPSDNTE